jgi:hypothetical protein
VDQLDSPNNLEEDLYNLIFHRWRFSADVAGEIARFAVIKNERETGRIAQEIVESDDVRVVDESCCNLFPSRGD